MNYKNALKYMSIFNWRFWKVVMVRELCVSEYGPECYKCASESERERERSVAMNIVRCQTGAAAGNASLLVSL